MSEGIIENNLWLKEAEMQKVHGMTPNEAHYYVLVEVEGKKVKEVADEEGVSVSTVKTCIQRARRKLSDKTVATRLYMIPFFPAYDRSQGYKIPVVMKVCSFLAEVFGVEFKVGKTNYLVALPAEQAGDVQWYLKNVASKIPNLVGGTEGEAKCREIGRKMADIVAENGAMDKIGWGILKYHLDQMGASYDTYEV